MNIFVLDTDTKKCALYHNDKHVIKMILETAQLLCGVHHMTESTHTVPYKLSHKNHPSAIWARQCIENYIWLCDLGIELSKEYTFRYGKTHKSQAVIEWCLTHKPKLKVNDDLTPFALAMPDECKVDDAIQSYRNYYMTEKRRMANWKNREIPEWFK
jgi:hypothetical protein